jgi:hypothetical protein
MAQNARDNRISRRSWLLAGLALPLFTARAGDELDPPLFDGDNLLPVLPPKFHFLTGKPLERLNGGSTVHFLADISLFTDDKHTTVKKSPVQHFIVSQDIWDRTFKVTIPNFGPHDKTGLTAAQAESWCLENLYISASGVPKDQPLWMRFRMSTLHQDDLSRVIGDDSISLTSFFEFISRRAGAGESQWVYETIRAFRLQDLKKMLFGRSNRLG